MRGQTSASVADPPTLPCGRLWPGHCGGEGGGRGFVLALREGEAWAPAPGKPPVRWQRHSHWSWEAFQSEGGDMALVLRSPGSDGGDITLFCLEEAGPAAPPGHQGQTEVPGPGLQLEALGLQDLNARQGRATSQLPDTPRAHSCGVALSLSAPPSPGGGADEGRQGHFCLGKAPGWGSGSNSGHSSPSLVPRNPRHFSSLQPTFSRSVSPPPLP